MTLVATIAHAALFTVFLWWFATGAILYLDGLPRRTFKLSMAAATALLGVALYGLWASQDDASVWGAFLAFACALVAWGWNEMAFLMGVVTGPRRTACPPGARGLARLRYAVEAVLWHEIAIALTALVIFAVTIGGANQVGFQTFAILWVLRLSAKVNVYLGVRNLSEEFLPPHLRYLESYFHRAPMNAAFPVSVTATTVLVAHFAHQALAPQSTAFEVTAATLLGTLTALALLEHWLLILPISATALWAWGLVSHAAQARVRAATVAGPAEDVAIVPACDLKPTAVGPTVVPFPLSNAALTSKTAWRRP